MALRQTIGRPRPVERRVGTRCRLFPQWPEGDLDEELETVWLKASQGSISPGPADERMYVVDPIDKTAPYGSPSEGLRSSQAFLPPWSGPRHPPVEPDGNGHFDHVDLTSPNFEAVHVFGAARFVLDIWENYFGRSIPWHFAKDQDRLEISLHREMDNATAGYGFMEIGSAVTADGSISPYSLNIDVIAHEMGHLILFSEMGLPSIETTSGEFLGFHESAADMVALISALHFERTVDRLLSRTSGNLYTFNALNRFAELSSNEQIRIASNPSRLQDFAAGWHDEHDLSQPLTGALFDMLVDAFHENLLDRGLISADIEDLADVLQRDPRSQPFIQSQFDDAYDANRSGFKEALLDARDDMGLMLAATWQALSPENLSYAEVGTTLLMADDALNEGRYQRLIHNNLAWRDIGTATIGPRLSDPNEGSHAFSVRTMTPDDF